MWSIPLIKRLASFLLLYSLCLIPSGQFWAATAYVQSAKTNAEQSDALGTIASTFGAAVGSAGAVCGAVSYHNGLGNLTSVTDNQSNTYTVVRNFDGTNQVGIGTFFALNITNAPTVITATYSNVSMLYRGMVIIEASGVKTSAALDQETAQWQATPGTGTDAVTSGAMTTTENGEFICGFAVVTSAFDANNFTAGTNYTERQETNPTLGIDLAVETRVQTTAGSIAATWTQVADRNTSTAIMTLKEATAGATRNRLWSSN